MTLSFTEPNSSPNAKICVLWGGVRCKNANVSSFKFAQQSDGCTTHTDRCKHVTVKLLVAITLMASVTICILNSFCTISYMPVCVILLLKKQTKYHKLPSILMVMNYIPISLLTMNLSIYNKTYSAQTHTEAKNTPHKTHNSATLTPNIYALQACITPCVQVSSTSNSKASNILITTII
jgi:hypothetical protein